MHGRKEFEEVVVFVLGMTPQIVTETLHALCSSMPPVYPDRIKIITTSAGREAVEARLVREGRLKGFFSEFGLEPIDPEVYVITDGRGRPLRDIRSADDNEAVGNYIVRLMRDLVAEPKVRLHCSIAGGRKTMSFYLGAALGLFGRPWDRLYHVLVTPEFESHPDFYWKPEGNRVLEVRDAEGVVTRRLNTRDAEITLAELPLLKLGGRFDPGSGAYREAVVKGQRMVDTALMQKRVVVDLPSRLVVVGDSEIGMAPGLIALYAGFLRAKAERCVHGSRERCGDCTDCFFSLKGDLWSVEAAEGMADDYGIAYGRRPGMVEEFMERWKQREEDGTVIDYYRQQISKINGLIRKKLGNDPLLASLYTVTPVGGYGSKRYGVRVEKGLVEVRSWGKRKKEEG